MIKKIFKSIFRENEKSPKLEKKEVKLTPKERRDKIARLQSISLAEHLKVINDIY